MPARRTPAQPDTPVEQPWNLPDLTASWIRAAGVQAYRDLAERDLVELWIELRFNHEQVTRLTYYALWGAVNDRHWNPIPDEKKARFDAELERRGFASRSPRRRRRAPISSVADRAGTHQPRPTSGCSGAARLSSKPAIRTRAVSGALLTHELKLPEVVQLD